MQMRNRKIQRALKKCDAGMVALKDSCGVGNPTEYQAVRNMIREEKQMIIRKMRSEAKTERQNRQVGTAQVRQNRQSEALETRASQAG